jgi:hypothetical protein
MGAIGKRFGSLSQSYYGKYGGRELLWIERVQDVEVDEKDVAADERR